ncbi:MAG TPA: hypothetical protein VM261_38835 [Kofleriaceae bacterium]|nr:hypothetical protein [Kofleriaceae bacterium]
MRTLPYVAAAILVAAGAGDVHADEEDAPKEDEPLSFAGRVFTRFTATTIDSEPWEGELALDSARLAVNYVWKEKVRTKVAVEAAGGVSVKDAFVDLKLGDGLSLRAGHFKIPISSLEQASAWTLPTIDRGVVADVLSEGITLTGRRDAVQLTWEGGERGPRVMVAASQSMSTDDLDPARSLSDGGGVAATLRVEQAFCPGIRVGVVGSNRETIDGATVDRFWAGGADVEVDLEDAGLGLRLWADALVGESHLGTFATAQVAGGWRFGGRKKNKKYVEPYLLGSFYNPSIDRKRDDVSEIIAGVAAGRWKRWRGQGQFSYVNAKGFRPAGLGGALVDVNDALTVTLQLGAAF